MKRFRLTILIRIQESLRCTRNEAVTLVSLLCLYGVGLLAQHVRSTVLPYDPAFYAPGDSLFRALTLTELGPSEAPFVDIIADTLEIPPEFPLDLNAASNSDLQHLPRIGPALAGRIIAYRSENGAFTSVEQLLDVSGIGDKTLEKLRPLVEIRPDSTADPPVKSDSLGC